MAWSGKLVGGLVGGMVAGPLGAGLGATLGHVLADGDRSLEVLGVEWTHHGFSASGPGMWLNPVWMARGREGRDVSVRIDLGDAVRKAVVVPDADVERCAVPRVFIPYDRVVDGARVVITLRSEGAAKDRAAFDVDLPNPVRRLGSSGPARAVMALVACARAGGRKLTPEDQRFIRTSFQEGQDLDEDGQAWLDAWLDELNRADRARLTAQKVAHRLDPHLDQDARRRMVTWLLRGPWAGEAQDTWIDTLACALGLDADTITSLRAKIDDGPDPWEVLGVAPGTPVEEVRRAWRALVQTWHPDRAPPGEAEAYTRKMAEINAAWRRILG